MFGLSGAGQWARDAAKGTGRLKTINGTFPVVGRRNVEFQTAHSTDGEGARPECTVSLESGQTPELRGCTNIGQELPNVNKLGNARVDFGKRLPKPIIRQNRSSAFSAAPRASDERHPALVSVGGLVPIVRCGRVAGQTTLRWPTP